MPEPIDFDDHNPFADGPDPTREIERRMNIHRLQNEAREVTGAEVRGFESDDAPPQVLEQFWQNVLAHETAPLTTMARKIEDAGIALPSADSLDDEALHAKLWEIIDFLAENGAYLESTNHLSDRELYKYLHDEGLRERVADPGSGWSLHMSPVGSCGEEEMRIIHRYYSDDKSRAMWMEDFPDYEMPPREVPPFDRDRVLPQTRVAHFEPPEGWDDEDAWDDESADS